MERFPSTTRQAGQKAYQSRVHEAHGRLSDRNPLLVDTVDDGRKDGRRCRGTANEGRLPVEDDSHVVANGREIRISTAAAVVDAAVGDSSAGVVGARRAVALVGSGHVAGQVGADNLRLVARHGIDVGEPTARGEAGDGALGIGGGASTSWEGGGAEGGDVGAGGGEVRVENLAGAAEAAIRVAVVGAAGRDAGVTRGDDDGSALHAELHHLSALALLVVGGQVVLLLAVGDGDDVGGLVDAALSLPLEATLGVGVLGVDWGVAGLAKGAEGAVGTVEGIEESVQEASSTLTTGGVVGIVGLEDDAVLWVDDGVGDLEIEVGLGSWAAAGSSATVDTIDLGLGGGGNVTRPMSICPSHIRRHDLRGKGAEELGQVRAGEVVTLLENAELIACRSLASFGDVVEG